MNLPNKLTVLRVFMVPPVLFFLVCPALHEDLSRLIAFVLFALAGVTDRLDGKIARERGLITDFGKFLDPVADKILVFGALAGLIVLQAYGIDKDLPAAVLLNRLTAVSLFILLLRDLVITSLRAVISSGKKVVLPANLSGKIKTVSQIVCVLVMLAEPLLTRHIPFLSAFDGKYILSFATLAVMTAATLISGAIYLRAYLPMLKE